MKKLREWRARRKYKRHRLQSIKAEPGLDLVTLGSDYGGWTFLNTPRLKDCTVISAGLGEDASFDIEFINMFDAKIIVVDPTPRAMAHFDEIRQNFGSPRETDYVAGGQQPITSYDLTKCTDENLQLVDHALWCRNEELRFFLPENPGNVSHSIVNFQNDYKQDTDHLVVSAWTLRDILQDRGIEEQDVEILKLDIEGAEVETLQHLLSDGLRPRQICVEFDELNKPGKQAFERVDLADAALRSAGYRCVYGNGTTDYLYLLEHAVEG